MNSGDESQCPRPLERHGVYLAAPGPADYERCLVAEVNQTIDSTDLYRHALQT